MEPPKKMIVVIWKASGEPWGAAPDGDEWRDAWKFRDNPFMDACRELRIRTIFWPPIVAREKVLALEEALWRRGVEVRYEASAQELNALEKERATAAPGAATTPTIVATSARTLVQVAPAIAIALFVAYLCAK